jgi:hypothetical protein
MVHNYIKVLFCRVKGYRNKEKIGWRKDKMVLKSASYQAG